MDSPFGKPSDKLLFGRLGGTRMVFLPRHGRGHVQSPTSINYRANIDAMKRAGATEILSVSACGSFREELAPGTFVLPDQFIDRTFGRDKSFFGTGLVAHVEFAHPVCSRLSGVLAGSCAALDIPFSTGGSYLAMEGPQFSTLAESNLYRSWGCSVIGMTNMPEAKLAREAELCYATVAMVTDYDCWHPDHDAVSVENVIGVLLANADKGRALVKDAAQRLAGRTGACAGGLPHRVGTRHHHRAGRTQPGDGRQAGCGGRARPEPLSRPLDQRPAAPSEAAQGSHRGRAAAGAARHQPGHLRQCQRTGRRRAADHADRHSLRRTDARLRSCGWIWTGRL